MGSGRRRGEKIIVPVYKKGDNQTVVIIESCHLCQLNTIFYQSSCCQG